VNENELETPRGRSSRVGQGQGIITCKRPCQIKKKNKRDGKYSLAWVDFYIRQTADPLIDISVHGLRPKINNTIHVGKDKRRQKESNASRLPLLQATVRNTLALVHLGGVFGGLEGEARGGQRLEVSAVVLVSL